VLQYLGAKDDIEGVVREVEMRNVALDLDYAVDFKLRHGQVERGHFGEILAQKRGKEAIARSDVRYGAAVLGMIRSRSAVLARSDSDVR
jgi:hypothetical protein